MDADEARSYIALRLQPDVDPVITASELDQLLEVAATADADGRVPTDDGWIPTYDVVGCHRAIVDGFEVKIAKAAGRVDFTADTQSFKRSQLLDRLESQRDLHARRINVSVSTGGTAH